MKKLLTSLLAIITVCFMTVAFAACANASSDIGGSGKNETIDYTVTEEKWSKIFSILSKPFTSDGFNWYSTCVARRQSDDNSKAMGGTLKVDKTNQVVYFLNYTEENGNYDFKAECYIKKIGSTINMYSKSEEGYNSVGSEVWKKTEYSWNKEFYDEILTRTVFGDLLNIELLNKYNICEYNEITKLYSLTDNNILYKLNFKNKNLTKLEITGMNVKCFYEFSDYGKTTVTIPQEVIDNAVEE